MVDREGAMTSAIAKIEKTIAIRNLERLKT